jgi:prepilin-type N-terminal cleavage/methylation domain-containing protein
LLTSRRGLTLAEVLIALAIVATVAAVLIPAVTSQLRRGQSASTASSLANFRDAIVAYRSNVLDYPRTLSQLTNALTVTATDACANVLSAAQRNAWRGPYMTQNVSGNVTVGDATLLDTLIRNPATDAGTPPGTLILRAINVDSAVAADIDLQFDGTLNFAAGTILWSNAGLDTLKFNIVIRNC